MRVRVARTARRRASGGRSPSRWRRRLLVKRRRDARRRRLRPEGRAQTHRRGLHQACGDPLPRGSTSSRNRSLPPLGQAHRRGHSRSDRGLSRDRTSVASLLSCQRTCRRRPSSHVGRHRHGRKLGSERAGLAIIEARLVGRHRRRDGRRRPAKASRHHSSPVVRPLSKVDRADGRRARREPTRAAMARTSPRPTAGREESGEAQLAPRGRAGDRCYRTVKVARRRDLVGRVLEPPLLCRERLDDLAAHGSRKLMKS